MTQKEKGFFRMLNAIVLLFTLPTEYLLRRDFGVRYAKFGNAISAAISVVIIALIANIFLAFETGKLNWTSVPFALLVLILGIIHWRVALRKERNGIKLYTYHNGDSLFQRFFPKIPEMAFYRFGEPALALAIGGALMFTPLAIIGVCFIIGGFGVAYFSHRQVAMALNMWRDAMDAAIMNETHAELMERNLYEDQEVVSERGIKRNGYRVAIPPPPENPEARKELSETMKKGLREQFDKTSVAKSKWSGKEDA